MQPRLLSVTFTAILSLLLQNLSAQNTSPYWSLAGNSNATSTSKLGTTNAIPLRILTKNTERLRIDTLGRIGIGTTAPGAPLDVRSTSNLLARFNGGSQMYMGLYENSTQRGYLGSFAGAAADVDFGTNTGNTTGKVHLTTKAVPRLTVDTAGYVGIGTTLPTARLHVVGSSTTVSPNTNAHAIRGVSSYFAGDGVIGEGYAGVRGTGSFEGVTGSGGSYGLRGFSTSGQYSYGVYSYGKYIGVYGEGLSWAGYFKGIVYSTGMYQGSDRRLKQNITDFSRALDIIGKLQPKQYEYRHDGAYKGMNLPKGKHYGLIAQEVEEVLPDLVQDATLHTPHEQGPTMQQASEGLTAQTTATTDFKAVNYTELIPIMIKGMQEQEAQNQTLNAEVEALRPLKDEVAELRQMILELKNVRNSTSIISAAYLEQNSPNPAGTATTIRYHLPTAATSARLTLTNTKGQVVKTMMLGNRGTGQISLNTQALSAGTYHYTLYVDGKSADTKRLLIAR